MRITQQLQLQNYCYQQGHNTTGRCGRRDGPIFVRQYILLWLHI